MALKWKHLCWADLDVGFWALYDSPDTNFQQHPELFLWCVGVLAGLLSLRFGFYGIWVWGEESPHQTLADRSYLRALSGSKSLPLQETNLPWPLRSNGDAHKDREGNLSFPWINLLLAFLYVTTIYSTRSNLRKDFIVAECLGVPDWLVCLAGEGHWMKMAPIGS